MSQQQSAAKWLYISQMAAIETPSAVRLRNWPRLNPCTRMHQGSQDVFCHHKYFLYQLSVQRSFTVFLLWLNYNKLRATPNRLINGSRERLKGINTLYVATSPLTCTCRVWRLPDGSWRRHISQGACKWQCPPFLWVWSLSTYWQTAAATLTGRNLQSEETRE